MERNNVVNKSDRVRLKRSSRDETGSKHSVVDEMGKDRYHGGSKS